MAKRLNNEGEYFESYKSYQESKKYFEKIKDKQGLYAGFAYVQKLGQYSKEQWALMETLDVLSGKATFITRCSY